MIRRYEKFRSLPKERRESIRAKGLKGFLLEPDDRPDARELPAPLREEIDRMPPEARARAARLLVMRWRQMTLDSALSRIPERAERRQFFRRLFPEPFDAEAARRANRELRERCKRIVVEDLVTPRLRELERERGREMTREERVAAAARLLDEEARAEERRIAERLREEVLRRRERGGGAEDRHRLLVFEKIEAFATPRERELIRYALRPEECPFLDLGSLGPPPRDPAERRLFEADRSHLARLDLLSETSLPTELVLHLADARSAEDLLRAFAGLRGAR